MIIAKDLTLDEFTSDVSNMSQVFYNAAQGNEIYRIRSTKSGAFVLMSEDEYNIHHDALRLLLENAALLPEELISKFKPIGE